MKFLLAAMLLAQSIIPDPLQPVAPETLPPSAAAPDIEFPVLSHDFGTVKPGEVVKFTFQVKNAGEAPLEISQVNPACGCTTPGEWSKLLAPGQQGEIPVQLDTARFKGPISKTIIVRSNDPDESMIILTLKGNIWTPVEYTPTVALIPALNGPDEVKSATVQIKNNTEEPLHITELQSSNPSFKADLITVTPGREYRLKITTVPPLQQGSNRGNITAKTSSSDLPLITLPAIATVLAPVQVVPSYIMLPGPALPTQMNRFIILVNRTQQPLQVSKLQTDVPNLHLDLEQAQPAAQAASVKEDKATVDPGKSLRVRVEFPAGFKLEQEGSITFETNHPEHPSFTVPIKSVKQS